MPFRAGPARKSFKWLDQLAPNPVPEVIKNQLVWEDLDSWITPNDKFFSIAHFNRPVIDASTWKLEIDGLVKNPMTLTLADIKARPRQEVTFTIECSGNHWPPVFQRRHRQCALGGHAARPDPEGGRRPRERHRGRLLGHRRRRDHATPTTSSSSRISRAACRSPTPWIQRTSFATR